MYVCPPPEAIDLLVDVVTHEEEEEPGDCLSQPLTSTQRDTHMRREIESSSSANEICVVKVESKKPLREEGEFLAEGHEMEN